MAPCLNCGACTPGTRKVPYAFAILFLVNTAVFTQFVKDHHHPEPMAGAFPICAGCGAGNYNNWLNNPHRKAFSAGFIRQFVTCAPGFSAADLQLKLSAYNSIVAKRVGDVVASVGVSTTTRRYACGICAGIAGVAACVSQSHNAQTHELVFGVAQAALKSGDAGAVTAAVAAMLASRPKKRPAPKQQPSEVYPPMHQKEMDQMFVCAGILSGNRFETLLRLSGFDTTTVKGEIEMSDMSDMQKWKFFMLAVPAAERAFLRVDFTAGWAAQYTAAGFERTAAPTAAPPPATVPPAPAAPLPVAAPAPRLPRGHADADIIALWEAMADEREKAGQLAAQRAEAKRALDGAIAAAHAEEVARQLAATSAAAEAERERTAARHDARTKAYAELEAVPTPEHTGIEVFLQMEMDALGTTGA
jgi:hypothetical protein